MTTLSITGAPSLTLAVTGATGFVGRKVLEMALADGHTVRALTRQPQPKQNGVAWITGTLADPAALDQLMVGTDAVLHIAGAVNVPTREAFAVANIAGTQAVIDAAARADISRFVHISSLAAREPALSNYGWSKAEGEDLVATSALDWTIVRPPGVYGEGDHDMLELFRMARRGIMLVPPPGRGSWIEVSDLAGLLLILARQPGQQEIYEPDDGRTGGIDHRQLAGKIAKMVGKPNAFILSAPRWLLHLAARGDRLVRGHKARLTPDRASYMAHPDWVAHPARAVPRAVWRARHDLDEGLFLTAEWYRMAGLLSYPS